MKTFSKQVFFAIQGLQYFLKNERNGRIQVTIMLLVVIAGFMLGLARMEWCAVLSCMALVISLEMVNTSIERVCAMLSTEYHPIVKIIKDVAAGAVLWTAIISVIIGAIVFLPHIFILMGI